MMERGIILVVLVALSYGLPLDNPPLNLTEITTNCQNGDYLYCAAAMTTETDKKCLDDETCTYLVAVEDLEDSYEFTIIASMKEDDVVAAIAFAESATMLNGIGGISCSLNETEVLVSLATNIESKITPTNSINGLTVIEAKIVEGYIVCQVIAPKTTITINRGTTISLDGLEAYYVIAASGKKDEVIKNCVASKETYFFVYEEYLYSKCTDSSDCLASKQGENDLTCLQDRSCKYLTYFDRVDQETYQFTTVLADAGESSYVAVGFSTDREYHHSNKSGAVTCILNNEVVDVKLMDKTNLVELNGVEVIENKKDGDYLTCTFTAKAVKFNDELTITFDGQGTPYYLIVAEGELDDGMPTHHNNYTISENYFINLPFYSKCAEKGYTCIGDAEKCIESRTCNYGTAFTKVDDRKVKFYTYAHSSANYFSIGFSKDGTMGDDGIANCIQFSNGTLDVTLNNMQHRSVNPVTLTDESVLTQGNHQLVDNHFTCEFTLAEEVFYNETFAVKLNKGDGYIILMAIGPINDTTGIIKHHTKYTVTSEKYFNNAQHLFISVPAMVISYLFVKCV